ncbi:MAG TPA: DUF4012 domain-containing protein [Iamia sp.]|nr:DUF4012 domain-containing protein [Iamia sp.]
MRRRDRTARRRGRSGRPAAWRRPAVRWIVLAVAGIGLVVGGFAALSLARAASDLRSARDQLDRVDDLVEQGRLGEAEDHLDAAYGQAATANGRLYGNPALDLVGGLPVAGPNLRSLRGSTGDSLELIDAGRRILRAGRPLADESGRLEVALRTGRVDAPAIVAVRQQLAAAAAALPRRDDGDDSPWLLGPVRDLHEEVTDESESRSRQFRSVAQGLEIVEDLSGAHGPRRFLVAVANPAEMRGAGGMILSYGVLEAEDGQVTVGEFGRIDELDLTEPVPDDQVDLPEDLRARWAGFDITERWRNTTVAAELPVMAPTLLAMYEQATGERADGVIQVDPVGLAALLQATGPVEVAELGTVDATNVVALTLNEAYVRYPDIDERADVLADVAEAAFDRLLDGEIPSLRGLGEAMLQTASQRHLAMWTRDTGAQAAIAAFGADATLPDPAAEHVHLGVQNISGNKLDYYVDTALALEGSRPAGDVGTVRATITVANTAPAGATEPRYVFGPFDSSERAGVYRGLVSLYVPRGTTLVSAGGDAPATPASVQAEDGRAVISYTIAVPAEGRHTIELELRLPPRAAGAYRLLAVPSARLRPTALHVALDLGDGDDLAADLALTRPIALVPGREPEPTTPG